MRQSVCISVVLGCFLAVAVAGDRVHHLRGRNVPGYSPTSVVLTSQALVALGRNVGNVVNAHLQPIAVPPWTSNDACVNNYGWNSASVTVNSLSEPTLRIREDSVQVDMTLELALSLSVFDNTQYYVPPWGPCITLGCGGNAASAGVISLSFGLGLPVTEGFLNVTLIKSAVAVPHDFKTSFTPSGFWCFLASGVAGLLGINLSGILNTMIVGFLSSPEFSADATAAVASYLQTFASSTQSIRICEVRFFPDLNRLMLTVPIDEPDGWYCNDGVPNSGPPPLGQFFCQLQDVMVVLSLQQYNLFNVNLTGIAEVGKAIVGNLLFPPPVSVSGEFVPSSLQVCATTQAQTKEEFLCVSVALDVH